jgi:hypothetical protein
VSAGETETGSGGGRDDGVGERLRALGEHTRDIGASGALRLRLLELAEGPGPRPYGVSRAIVRLAAPSLVAASLAALALYASAPEPTLDDVLASAATSELSP